MQGKLFQNFKQLFLQKQLDLSTIGLKALNFMKDNLCQKTFFTSFKFHLKMQICDEILSFS